MLIEHLFMTVTKCTATCDRCGEEIVLVALGGLSPGEIEMISDKVKLCPDHQYNSSQALWLFAYDLPEGMSDAAHK